MRDAHKSNLSHYIVCKTWPLDYAHLGSRMRHSHIEVHVRWVENALGLGDHVVIDVVRLAARFHHEDVIPSAGMFPFWI